MKKGIIDLRIIAILFLVVMAGLTWWRSTDKEIRQAEEIQMPVKTAKPVLRDLEKIVELNAYISSDQRFPLFTQAPGIIDRILVKKGQHVKKDELLIVMDQAAIQVQLNLAQTAYDYAMSEYKRISVLYNQQLISEQDFKKAANALDNTKSQLSIANLQMDNTEIRSPFDGVIVDIMVKEQQLAGSQSVLIDISSTGNPIIEVGVPESLYPYFTDNTPEIRVSHKSRLGTAIYEAQLQSVSPVIDPRSGTFKITSTVGNIIPSLSDASLQKSKGSLIPGMFVKVELIVQKQIDAYTLPFSSLDSRGNIWTLDAENMTVSKADSNIRTGFENSEYFAVSKAHKETLFVVEGQHLLTEGMNVRLLK